MKKSLYSCDVQLYNISRSCMLSRTGRWVKFMDRISDAIEKGVNCTIEGIRVGRLCENKKRVVCSAGSSYGRSGRH